MDKWTLTRRDVATLSLIFEGSATFKYENLTILFGGFLYQESGRRMIWRDVDASRRRDAIEALQLMGCKNVVEYERKKPLNHNVVNHNVATSRRSHTSQCGKYYKIITVDGVTRRFLKEERFRDALKRDREKVASAWGPDGKRYFAPKEA